MRDRKISGGPLFVSSHVVIRVIEQVVLRAGHAEIVILVSQRHRRRGADARVQRGGARLEGVPADDGDAVGQVYGGQSAALEKRGFRDAGHAVRHRNAYQAFALEKRGNADGRNAVRDDDLPQGPAEGEGVIADLRHMRGHIDLRQRPAAVEGRKADAGHAVRQNGGLQVFAAVKGVIADARHAAFHLKRLHRGLVPAAVAYFARAGDHQPSRAVQRPGRALAARAARIAQGGAAKQGGEYSRQCQYPVYVPHANLLVDQKAPRGPGSEAEERRAAGQFRADIRRDLSVGAEFLDKYNFIVLL